MAHYGILWNIPHEGGLKHRQLQPQAHQAVLVAAEDKIVDDCADFEHGGGRNRPNILCSTQHPLRRFPLTAACRGPAFRETQTHRHLVFFERKDLPIPLKETRGGSICRGGCQRADGGSFPAPPALPAPRPVMLAPAL